MLGAWAVAGLTPLREVCCKVADVPQRMRRVQSACYLWGCITISGQPEMLSADPVSGGTRSHISMPPVHWLQDTLPAETRTAIDPGDTPDMFQQPATLPSCSLLATPRRQPCVRRF